jgi:hypothetical protein
MVRGEMPSNAAADPSGTRATEQSTARAICSGEGRQRIKNRLPEPEGPNVPGQAFGPPVGLVQRPYTASGTDPGGAELYLPFGQLANDARHAENAVAPWVNLVDHGFPPPGA